jgi:hypothetical protein
VTKQHKRYILAAVVLLVVLLAAGWCSLLYVRIGSMPDLAGGVTVTCDADARIFVGERLMDSNPLLDRLAFSPR